MRRVPIFALIVALAATVLMGCSDAPVAPADDSFVQDISAIDYQVGDISKANYSDADVAVVLTFHDGDQDTHLYRVDTLGSIEMQTLVGGLAAHSASVELPFSANIFVADGERYRVHFNGGDTDTDRNLTTSLDERKHHVSSFLPFLMDIYNAAELERIDFGDAWLERDFPQRELVSFGSFAKETECTTSEVFCKTCTGTGGCRRVTTCDDGSQICTTLDYWTCQALGCKNID